MMRVTGLLVISLTRGDQVRPPAVDLRVHERDAVGGDEDGRVAATAADDVEGVLQLVDGQPVERRRRLLSAAAGRAALPTGLCGRLLKCRDGR